MENSSSYETRLSEQKAMSEVHVVESTAHTYNFIAEKTGAIADVGLLGRRDEWH